MPNRGQMEAVAAALEDGGVFLLLGDAGTGKSHVVSVVEAALLGFGTTRPLLTGKYAPSAKAAGNIRGRTLHDGWKIQVQADGQLGMEVWGRLSDDDLGNLQDGHSPYGAYVCDEVCMCARACWWLSCAGSPKRTKSSPASRGRMGTPSLSRC